MECFVMCVEDKRACYNNMHGAKIKKKEYVTSFTMLNLIFDIACPQQEVLKGNYVAFRRFCTGMSIEENNNNKKLIIIQINNPFMCIIFINAEFDYINP